MTLRVTGQVSLIDGSTQQEAAAIEFAADGNHANNDVTVVEIIVL